MLKMRTSDPFYKLDRVANELGKDEFRLFKEMLDFKYRMKESETNECLVKLAMIKNNKKSIGYQDLHAKIKDKLIKSCYCSIAFTAYARYVYNKHTISFFDFVDTAIDILNRKFDDYDVSKSNGATFITYSISIVNDAYANLICKERRIQNNYFDYPLATDKLKNLFFKIKEENESLTDEEIAEIIANKGYRLIDSNFIKTIKTLEYGENHMHEIKDSIDEEAYNNKIISRNMNYLSKRISEKLPEIYLIIFELHFKKRLSFVKISEKLQGLYFENMFGKISCKWDNIKVKLFESDLIDWLKNDKYSMSLIQEMRDCISK